jgi:hypothetical protein
MHTKLGIDGTKFGCTHVTHKNTHDVLDSIDLEGCAYHLSNQTHSARPKYAGDVLGQSPLFSAFSGEVVVSKVSRFVRLPTLTYGAQWQ